MIDLKKLFPDRKVITVTEFLDMGFCSRPTLYQLIKDGEIRVMKVGSATRILIEPLQEWIDKNTLKPDSNGVTRTPYRV